MRFTQDGVAYTFNTEASEDGETFTITIREADSQLFVKQWTSQTSEQIVKLQEIASRGGRIVLKRDLKAMQILEYYEYYYGMYGKMPRLRDIVLSVGLPSSEVGSSQRYLVTYGFLSRVPHLARGYTLLKRREDA